MTTARRVPLTTPASRARTATPVSETRIPAHYLTTETRGYPLVLLSDGVDTGAAFPVGVGLMPLEPDVMRGPCPECGYLFAVEVQGVDDSPRDLECLPCLLFSEAVAPAHTVEWVPYE